MDAAYSDLMQFAGIDPSQYQIKDTDISAELQAVEAQLNQDNLVKFLQEPAENVQLATKPLFSANTD